MAGTLFSLPLSQRFDANGQPLQNAPLYIYAAATSDPADVYSDYGLTEGLKHPWPLRTDSNGIIPAFWLEDGQYRARFTDEAGAVVYFDISVIQALGPSEGTGSGGGASVDETAIFDTGDFLWKPAAGARTGWVRSNGRTIGSASSGATERANADTQPLYEFFWNNYSDTLCPVTGGRGASASADFAANKPIGTLDMRGYGPVGLDDMGNSAAGRILAGTPLVAGSSGGSETRTLAEGNLPSHTHTASVTDNGHVHANSKSVLATSNLAGGGISDNRTTNFTDTDSATTGISVANSSTGSGTAVNIMSPYRLGTWYAKL